MTLDILLATLLTAGGAAIFRLRGSSLWHEWTGRGATTIRLIWGTYLGAVAFIVAPLAWWVPPALAVAFWLGTIGPWWGSLDLGRNEGSFARDFVLHTLRGFLWTLPAAAVLWFVVGWDAGWLLVAGGLCGVIYAISGRVYAARATENAEWAFGAAITASLLTALS